MAKLDPAIRHAITPVIFDEHKLHRERLVDAIHAEIERRLIVIAAPAGYGKTTLLADFCSHSDVPQCWIRVTETHTELMSLGETVIASLENRFRRIRGEVIPSRFATVPPQGIAQAISDLILKRIPETFFVILDDVQHLATSENSISFLDELVNRTPDNVTFIHSGRQVLEVSLARLMANGELAALGPHDLALTDGEAIELARKLVPDQESWFDPAQVNRELRGWVTGLVLYSQAKSMELGDALAGPQELIYSYFASTVLNRSGEKLRRFMLRSSILPSITPSAVDEVLEIRGSENVIDRLSGSRFFIDRTRLMEREYEYHPLFREFLRETFLAADPAEFRRISRRAADYYASIGATEWAIKTLIELRDYHEALDLAISSAPEFYSRGRYQVIDGWIRSLEGKDLPLDDLYLWAASARLEMGDNEETLELVERLQGGAPSIDSHESVRRRFRAYFLAAYANLRLGEAPALREGVTRLHELSTDLLDEPADKSLLSRFHRLQAEMEWQHPSDDWRKAEGLAKKALEYAISSGEALQVAHSYHVLALVQTLKGDHFEASVTGDKAIAALRDVASPTSVAAALNNQAVRVFRNGDYQEALLLLSEALEEARAAGSMSIEATALISQAEIFSDLGLTVQAAQLFEQGLNLAVRSGDNYLITEACVGSAIVHRRNGTHAMAAKWLERAVDLRSDDLDRESHQILAESAAIRVEVSPKTSAQICTRMLESEAGLDSYIRTKALLVRIQAQFDELSEDRLSKLVRECLDFASTSGSLQHLAGECNSSPYLVERLTKLAAGHPAMETILHKVELMRSMSESWVERQTADKQPQEAKIRVYAMGGSRIKTGSGVSVDSLKPQALELLYYLIDRGQCQREDIVAAFWQGHSEGRQAANLHMAVYSLRQAIGKNAILLEGATYRLVDDIIEYYDVEEFERSSMAAERLPEGDPRRLFALTNAISSYSGAYLIEYDSAWVLERRRRLDQAYLDLVARHADETLVRNDPGKALRSLRAALDIDPYRDDLNLRYLRVLHRLGRRSEVVSHFDRYRRLIQADLGLDLPETVREEYSRMIR